MAYKINAKLYGTGEISYVPYGTIGWVKTHTKEVRQCKCIGAIWKEYEDDKNYLEVVYEWKVAGVKEHQFGTMYHIPIGSIYRTESLAQFGSSDKESHLSSVETIVASIPDLLFNKYSIDRQNCVHFYGFDNDVLYFESFAIKNDNSIGLTNTDFYLVLDKNGIDVIVPMFENEVNGERRYPTEEEAKRNIVLGKVYLLEDDED